MKCKYDSLYRDSCQREMMSTKGMNVSSMETFCV